MRHVILPQAIRRVAPPLLNDFVALQKDVALISIIGPQEAFRVAQIYQGENFNYTPIIAAALLYLVITVPLARVVDRMGGGGGRCAELGAAAPVIEVARGDQGLRRARGPARGRLRRRRARGGGADRRLRLGQVDAAALHRPARGDRRRRHLPRRRGDHRPLGRRRSRCGAGSASSSRPTTSSRT